MRPMGAMGRRGWAVVAAALLFGGVGLWVTCDGADEVNDPTARARAYAARIGLPLPEGTRVEFAEWTTGLDDSAHLGFVMSEAGWTSLHAELPVLAFEPENNFHLGRDRGDWRPQSAPGLTTAQVRWRDRAEVLNVEIAPLSPGEVRVFVFWHQI